MATLPLTLDSERWLDVVVLRSNGTANEAGADTSNTFTLPAGLGDVALMCAQFYTSGIVTMVATPSDLGAMSWIQTVGGSTQVDIPGELWVMRKISATEIAGSLDPDALVLWRQDELLGIVIPELDTNASPGGDTSYRFKCVRVRPVDVVGAPLQLVR